jgi:DNA-binding transcriptional LysR family regulator
MKLNSDQLEAFWAVAGTKNFHKAAGLLFISQSAVTQRINALEKFIGQKLFNRNAKGISLTETGEKLLRYCSLQREAETGFLNNLSADEGALKGALTVACGSVEAGTFILPVLSGIGRENPLLDISLKIDETIAPLEYLENRNADVVINREPVQKKGIRSYRLAAVDYLMVISSTAGLEISDKPGEQELKKFRAIDFSPHDKITLNHLYNCFPDPDFSGLKRYFVNDDRSILEWVLSGGGFSVLPEILVLPYTRQGKLKILFPEIKSTFYFYLTFPESRISPAIKLLHREIKKKLAKD